ncbi:Imm5 family immunity protein, partial [Actinomyces viscosus]
PVTTTQTSHQTTHPNPHLNRLCRPPEGILSLEARTRVWEAMLDPEDAEESYRRQIQLKIMCVRRVQRYWDRAFPGDERIEGMLSLVEDVVECRVGSELAELRSGRFLMDAYDRVEDYNSITQPAVFVADGAVHAVSSATHRNPEYDVSDDTQDDDELLPDSLETSYACASAAAGALNWQPVEEADVPARRGFWLWYLDEAIPEVLAG